MKSFLYGFCNFMGTRLELPYFGESGKYLLGEFTAVMVCVLVFTFTIVAFSFMLADMMLGRF